MNEFFPSPVKSAQSGYTSLPSLSSASAGSSYVTGFDGASVRPSDFQVTTSTPFPSGFWTLVTTSPNLSPLTSAYAAPLTVGTMGSGPSSTQGWVIARAPPTPRAATPTIAAPTRSGVILDGRACSSIRMASASVGGLIAETRMGIGFGSVIDGAGRSCGGAVISRSFSRSSLKTAALW